MSLEEVLCVTPKEEEYIRKFLEKGDKEIDEDVETIKEWLLKQPHLPPNEDEHRIRQILKINKFSLEKTKQKLDMYYSIKHMVPEIFDNRNFMDSNFTDVMETMQFFPLPHLTSDCTRIKIFRFTKADSSKFNVNYYFKLVFSIFDIQLIYDKAIGEHYICDLDNAKLGHVIQFTPALIRKAYTVLEKAYSDRIKGIHYVNVPSLAIPLVNTISAILSEKIANRIHIHKDYEGLQKALSKQCLPTEYGGTAGNMNDLYDKWKKYLYSKNDWVIEISNRKSDENRRIGEPLNSDMFGMCGSFRKLNVD